MNIKMSCTRRYRVLCSEANYLLNSIFSIRAHSKQNQIYKKKGKFENEREIIGFKKKSEKRSSRNEKILFASIIAYIVVLSTLTSLKHYCFRTLAFDFGIFVQIFWHSNHGNYMFTQPRGTPLHPPSFLGVHFSPLLMALIPLYGLIPSPYLLLALQTTALALPAYYIYKIGVEVTGRERLSLIYAIGYLLYPGTLWSNWYDFHLESFVPLFVSMAYYHYLRGARFRLILSMILLLATFERAVFIVVAFIIYVFVREAYMGRKREVRSLGSNAEVNILLISMLIISAIYFVGSERVMAGVWPEREELQPAMIFGRLSYEDILVKISYFAILSAPLAFLSFNSPLELLPALPYIILATTTGYRPYFTIPWQYPALISIPFFVSAIFGGIQEDPRRNQSKLIIFSTLAFLLITPASPLMSRFSANWAPSIPTRETQLKHNALSQLEANASILAQENIFPNIADRETAYTQWPSDLEPPDYIVFDVLNYLFYYEPVGHTTRDAVFQFLGTGEYGLLTNVNGFMILKRGYEGLKTTPSHLRFSLKFREVRKPFVSFEDSFSETEFFVPSWVEVRKDHLFIKKDIVGGVWWGSWITVPPGNYTVKLHLWVDERADGPLLDINVYQYRDLLYHTETIQGGEIEPGTINVLTFGFELKKWISALEVGGVSHGNSDLWVYKVEVEETP